MDTDTILSFQTASREGPRVRCGPSPVMELIYAHYYLTKRFHHPRGFEVPWAEPLVAADPQLVPDFETFWAGYGLEGPGPELFVLAAGYEYVFDGGPERFLRELGTLPARYLRDGLRGPTDDPETPAEDVADLRRRLDVLLQPAAVAAFTPLLARLWAQLEPAWRDHGYAAVSTATQAFETAFERTGSVLEALPPHHFTRFEHLSKPILEAAEHARVTVVPLWLASGGGFGFRVDDVQYVGFGLQSEHVFERTAERVGALARRVKALSDPNRLLVLTLVSTFAGMRPTVGDLAEQIGVSQPTVSGHLRLLREAGLVAVEKRGNKSFYRLEPEVARALLRDLEETLLR